jgi:flagellar assembly factor FliW
MKIRNPAIGEIEFEENAIITFCEGMLGLPAYKHFLLLKSENIAPFLRLQCVDEPTISFLLIDPAFLDPGYRNYVAKADSEQLYLQGSEECVLLVVCKVSRGGEDITANMVAPVAINHQKMTGSQFILLDSPYNVRHSLAEVSERMEA